MIGVGPDSRHTPRGRAWSRRGRLGLRPGLRVRLRLVLAVALSLALALVVEGTALAGEALAEPRIKTEGCKVYATNQVDSIAGADHLHNQFGNTSTTDDSSGESLFANKETSCATDWFTSAAWFPVERGEPVSGISTYYRAPGNQPVEEIPQGLQLLGEEVMYNCTSSGAGSFEETPPYGCRGEWTTRVVFPDCWNEDSLEEMTMTSSNNGSCPSTHPYRIPEISFLIRHDNADGEVTEPLTVSGGVNTWEPYTEMHADYFAALQPAFEPLVDRCLREGGSCEDAASAAERDAARSAVAQGGGASSDETTDDANEGDTNTGQQPTANTDNANEGDGDTDTTVESLPEEGEENSGPITGIGTDIFNAIFENIQDGIEEEAKVRTEDMAEQVTEGRYMIEAPNNALTGIYEDTANWAKPAAIALLLLLGLSMMLRGANYDTAYAAQTGIPKIVTVLAAIAFMPEIINLIADLTQEISKEIVDEKAMQAAFERLAAGELVRDTVDRVTPGIDPVSLLVWIIKLVLSVLILFAIAVRNLVFGALYIIGPLALIFHAIPRFSDVAAAWFRGILACFAISVLWALEFGLGYRFVGDPTLLYSGTGWRTLPLLFSLGILWLVWKTPWWVFSWAFHSYNPSGGGGIRGAIAALSLLKGLRGGGK